MERSAPRETSGVAHEFRCIQKSTQCVWKKIFGRVTRFQSTIANARLSEYAHALCQQTKLMRGYAIVYNGLRFMYVINNGPLR
jgi:hypothetical protein